MYKKILVPLALDHGIAPQTLGVAKALIVPGGEIVAFHVYEAPQGSVSVYLDKDAVKSGFERAQARLSEKVTGLDGVTAVILTGHTARTIIDYVTEHDFDCIVIGSHKPDLRDYLLGSTAGRVVRHAPCAVHVQRTRD
ncbi:universal stress protein [Sedimentitalea todarodis]|uniref:Universal stress protein n=1 Tax=Sedimentitalea todarodis TaxID=1631240 RepID=A0ABU3VJ03_9RHOB|nr:universal stress protein [Sedimentitalea todarodis]MDU9005980.1 universal stress protein [Sedimentitalea todarodis]